MRHRTRGSSRAWLIALLFAPAASQDASAAPLLPPVNQRVDVELHGDDPFAAIPVDLVPNPAVPLLARVDGYFENLVPFETVVRHDVYWLTPDGTYDAFNASEFYRLPPPAELATVPVHFEQTIAYTPGQVYLFLEGGGPGDHVRFVGEFELVYAPEPAATGVVMSSALFGACRRRPRRP